MKKILIAVTLLLIALSGAASAQGLPNPLGIEPMPSAPVCHPVWTLGAGYQIVCQ